MVDHYHNVAFKYWDRVLLYLIIPLLVILILFCENRKEYGFSFGDWKLGLNLYRARNSFHGPHYLLPWQR